MRPSLQQIAFNYQHLNNYIKSLFITLLMAFSDSPTYLFNNSGPFTAIKLALEAFATALANNVLPHPGGPHSNTPAGAFTANFSKISGFQIGNTIHSSSVNLRLYNEPISFQDTFIYIYIFFIIFKHLYMFTIWYNSKTLPFGRWLYNFQRNFEILYAY